MRGEGGGGGQIVLIEEAPEEEEEEEVLRRCAAVWDEVDIDGRLCMVFERQVGSVGRRPLLSLFPMASGFLDLARIKNHFPSPPSSKLTYLRPPKLPLLLPFPW